MSQMEVGYYNRPIARFHNSYIRTECGCWEWQNYLSKDGYGKIYVDGRHLRAHRYSYMLHKGHIPDSLVVRHKCDNPKCVNPEHLEIGTHKDNMEDKANRDRAKGINSGERNGSNFLSESNVHQIRDLLNCRLFSQNTIASMYKIDQSHVSRIKNRYRW